jgi:hypothetical protein
MQRPNKAPCGMVFWAVVGWFILGGYLLCWSDRAEANAQVWPSTRARARSFLGARVRKGLSQRTDVYGGAGRIWACTDAGALRLRGGGCCGTKEMGEGIAADAAAEAAGLQFEYLTDEQARHELTEAGVPLGAAEKEKGGTMQDDEGFDLEDVAQDLHDSKSQDCSTDKPPGEV